MVVEALAGVVAGVLGRYVFPDSLGIGPDMLMGLAGGGISAFVFKLFGHRLSFDQFSITSVATSLAGGLLLVALSRMMAGRRAIS